MTVLNDNYYFKSFYINKIFALKMMHWLLIDLKNNHQTT